MKYNINIKNTISTNFPIKFFHYNKNLLIISTSDKKIRIININSGEITNLFEFKEKQPSIILSKNDKYLIIHDSLKKILLFEIEIEEKPFNLDECDIYLNTIKIENFNGLEDIENIYSIIFYQEKDFLLFYAENSKDKKYYFYILDIDSNKVVSKSPEITGYVKRLDINNDGTLLTARLENDNEKIIVWELPSFKIVSEYNICKSYGLDYYQNIQGLFFNPLDNNQIFILEPVSPYNLKVYDIKEKVFFEYYSKKLFKILISPDNTKLVLFILPEYYTNISFIEIWDLKTNKCIQKIEHVNSIKNLVPSFDCSRFAISSLMDYSNCLFPKIENTNFQEYEQHNIINQEIRLFIYDFEKKTYTKNY